MSRADWALLVSVLLVGCGGDIQMGAEDAWYCAPWIGAPRIAVSGRPEDMCDKCSYSGKAGIGCFGQETLLSSERGHRRTPAAAEE